jgi:hypothetical protein
MLRRDFTVRHDFLLRIYSTHFPFIQAYSFLNPSKGSKKLAIYIVGIAIGQCVVFLLVNGLIYVRKRLTRRIVECDGPNEKLSKNALA